MSALDRVALPGERIVWRFEGQELTRREVLLARAVYAGARSWPYNAPSYRAEMEAEAAGRFPLPMVTRPRVVRDDSGPAGVYLWRVVDGVLQCQHEHNAGGVWLTLGRNADGMYVNAARVRLLADLLANPTETVEEPG